MEKRKKKVGEAAQELWTQGKGEALVMDVANTMLKDLPQEAINCIETHKKIFPGDFYVEIYSRGVEGNPNAYRLQYFATRACPTPDVDRCVYKYHRNKDEVELLWAIPCRAVCEMYRDNAIIVDKSERDLLNYVLDFYSGDLDKRGKILNNEKKDSSLLDI